MISVKSLYISAFLSSAVVWQHVVGIFEVDAHLPAATPAPGGL